MLGQAKPPVRFVDAGHHDNVEEPVGVIELRRLLVRDAGDNVIPDPFRRLIEIADPVESDELSTAAISTSGLYPSALLPSI